MNVALNNDSNSNLISIIYRLARRYYLYPNPKYNNLRSSLILQNLKINKLKMHSKHVLWFKAFVSPIVLNYYAKNEKSYAFLFSFTCLTSDVIKLDYSEKVKALNTNKLV